MCSLPCLKWNQLEVNDHCCLEYYIQHGSNKYIFFIAYSIIFNSMKTKRKGNMFPEILSTCWPVYAKRKVVRSFTIHCLPILQIAWKFRTIIQRQTIGWDGLSLKHDNHDNQYIDFFCFFPPQASLGELQFGVESLYQTSLHTPAWLDGQTQSNIQHWGGRNVSEIHHRFIINFLCQIFYVSS